MEKCGILWAKRRMRKSADLRRDENKEDCPTKSFRYMLIPLLIVCALLAGCAGKTTLEPAGEPDFEYGLHRPPDPYVEQSIPGAELPHRGCFCGSFVRVYAPGRQDFTAPMYPGAPVRRHAGGRSRTSCGRFPTASRAGFGRDSCPDRRSGRPPELGGWENGWR